MAMKTTTVAAAVTTTKKNNNDELISDFGFLVLFIRHNYQLALSFIERNRKENTYNEWTTLNAVEQDLRNCTQ